MPEFAIYEIVFQYRTYLNGGQRLPINMTDTVVVEGRAAAQKVVDFLVSLGIEPDLRPYRPPLSANEVINRIRRNMVEFPQIPRREDVA